MNTDVYEILLENTGEVALPNSTKLAEVCDSLDAANIRWDLEDEIGTDISNEDWQRLCAGTVGELMEWCESNRK